MGDRLVERQRRTFTDRVRRIEAGGPNTSGTVYAGVDEQVHRRRKRKRGPGGASVLTQLFMVPFAIAVGAASMLAGRAGAYHAMAAPDFIPVDQAGLFVLVGDIAISVGVATIAVALFSLGRGPRLAAFMLGFLAVMLGEATLIAQAPETFVSLFSESYVQTALAKAPETPFSPEALGL